MRKLSKYQMKNLKILVNGCSYSSATVPDYNGNKIDVEDWPIIFSNKINAELVNIALPGKDNNWMIEETIRYLLNNDDIDHVIIHFTEWPRHNLYKKNKSFEWVPGDLTSQINRLQKDFKSGYINRPYFLLQRNNNTMHDKIFLAEFGDESFVYETIFTGTLTNCLYKLCLSRNIQLTLINLYPLGDSKDDIVWSQIPNDLFLFSNNRVSGVIPNFASDFERPDGAHFEHKYHYAFAEQLESYYKNSNQIIGNIESKLKNIIYDYT